MSDFGKALVVIGLALAGLGAVLWLGGRLNLPLGRLPGDIRVEREHFKFYFPLTTCVLLSVVLTVILWLLGRGK